MPDIKTNKCPFCRYDPNVEIIEYLSNGEVVWAAYCPNAPMFRNHIRCSLSTYVVANREDVARMRWNVLTDKLTKNVDASIMNALLEGGEE